ncbi:MAG: hypothetical protein QOC66_1, partial [Pseudonocardiales bacterium]|nr:hypothetical protein [Pseudonocardiales bacterium]
MNATWSVSSRADTVVYVAGLVAALSLGFGYVL